MTHRFGKKLLALLLALTMCFSLLPAPAFAEEAPAAEVQTQNQRLEATSSLGTLITNSVARAGSTPRSSKAPSR